MNFEIGDVEIKMTPNWQDQLDIDGPMGSLCEDITKDAKRYCPVRTGALRDSLMWEKADSGNGTDDLGTWRVGSKDKDYSVYQELGTSRMAAQPYLRPALEQKRSI